MTDINTLKPLNDDVIIQYYDYNNVSGSSIIIEDKSSDEVTTHYCKVLRVSDNVTMVKEGDIIVLSWLNITPPFTVYIDGKEEKVHITTEDRILGVVDGI